MKFKDYLWWAAITVVKWGFFIAWQGYGVHGAGMVLVPFLWLTCALAIILGPSMFMEDEAEKLKRAKWFLRMNVLIDAGWFIALAWVGHTWLAIAMSIASLWLRCFREAARMKLAGELPK